MSPMKALNSIQQYTKKAFFSTQYTLSDTLCAIQLFRDKQIDVYTLMNTKNVTEYNNTLKDVKYKLTAKEYKFVKRMCK